MLHQEINAMLLERNGKRLILGNPLQHFEIGNVELMSARRAFIGANFAFDNDTRFLRETLQCVKYFRGNGILGNNALNNSAAIAEDGKEQLPAFAQVVKPSADGDRLAFVLPDFRDCGYRGVHALDHFTAEIADLAEKK